MTKISSLAKEIIFKQKTTMNDFLLFHENVYQTLFAEVHILHSDLTNTCSEVGFVICILRYV